MVLQPMEKSKYAIAVNISSLPIGLFQNLVEKVSLATFRGDYDQYPVNSSRENSPAKQNFQGNR